MRFSQPPLFSQTDSTVPPVGSYWISSTLHSRLILHGMNLFPSTSIADLCPCRYFLVEGKTDRIGGIAVPPLSSLSQFPINRSLSLSSNWIFIGALQFLSQFKCSLFGASGSSPHCTRSSILLWWDWSPWWDLISVLAIKPALTTTTEDCNLISYWSLVGFCNGSSMMIESKRPATQLQSRKISPPVLSHKSRARTYHLL